MRPNRNSMRSFFAPALRRVGPGLLSATLGVASFTAVASLTGCEDASARAQRNAQNEIDAVVEALAAKRLVDPSAADADAVAKARSNLSALAARLAAIQGGAAGQQAAANLLGASIQAEMGRLASDQLQRIQLQVRGDRSALAGLVEAGFSLDTLATAAEQFDPSKDRADLARLRAEAGERVDELKQAAAKLAGPIAQLTTNIDGAKQSLQTLDRAEMELRSQARTAGPVAGYQFVEQAAQKRAESDALRIGMARHDVELMELKPTQAFLLADATQRQDIMAQLDAASNDLKAMADDSHAIAKASRERIAAIKAQVAERLGTMNSQLNGPAEELFTQADGDFGRSAQLAQRASGADGGRDLALAAKAMVATARQSLAALAFNRTVALGEQQALLSALVQGGSLFGDETQLKAQLDAVQKARNEAVEKAKEAATAALEAVGQAGGDTPGAATVKANLTAMIDALSGRTPVAAPAASNAMTGGSAPSTSGNAGGFDSPEAILDFLKRGDFKTAATWRAMPNLYKASSPGAKAVLTFLKINAEDGAELNAAIVEKLGMDAIRDPSLTGGVPVPDPTTLSVTDVNENGAKLTGGPGQPPVVLVKAGGRWFIDLDATMAAASDPTTAAQQQQMIGQMTQQLQAIRPMLKQVYGTLTQRVKAGEFKSVSELQAAIVQTIMEKMMGGNAPGGADMRKMMEDAGKQLQNLTPEERKKLEELGIAPPK